MLIADRNGIVVGSGVWRNPYVTDGLVAMWDGQWNAGPGVHDPNATTWVDLSGNGNDMVVGSPGLSFGDDSMLFSGVAGAYWYVANLSEDLIQMTNRRESSDDSTIACVCEFVAIKQSFQDNSVICGPDNHVYGARFAGTSCYVWTYIGQRATFNAQVTALSIMTQDVTIPNVMARARNKIYKDGSIFYDSGITRVSSTFQGPTQYFRVGANPGFEGVWTGKLHNVRLYNRVLSDSEVAANYEVDAIRFNLTGGGRECVIILILLHRAPFSSRSRSRFSRPRQPSSEWRAAA